MSEERMETAVPEEVAAIFTTECEALSLNSNMKVRENYCYSFTPQQKGTYTLWSQGSTEMLDMHGYLFDSERNLLQENDNCKETDKETDFNFSIYYEMEAGETYYLVIDVKGEHGGDAYEKRNAGFSVTVSETLQDESVILEPETEPGAGQRPGQDTERETQQEESPAETEETEKNLTGTKSRKGHKGTGADTGTETETETESKTNTETETEPQTDTETEMDTYSGTETEKAAAAGAEPESESETETSALASVTGQILDQGAGFAVGVFVAAVAALLVKGRRKNKNNAPEKPHVEEEIPGQREESRIGKTHGIGKRNDQQDSFYAVGITDVENARMGDMLAIVADGMGGLRNGALVSNTAVKVSVDTFYQRIGTTEPADVILEMAINVNEEVNRMLQNMERSGSTLVIGLIWQGLLYFLTIGDSRIWLWRDGGLIRLNRVHNYQEELVVKAINNRDGLHSVHQDPQRKNLTSYVGQGMIKYVDRNDDGIRLKKGDKVLLASDGVFGTVDEQELEQLLKQPAPNAALSIQDTIEKSDKPHQDNYTAVILEYNE